MAHIKDIRGSFRDPSGYVFIKDGIVFRQVNQSYRCHYDSLVNSGLYDELAERQMLIPHEESHPLPIQDDRAYRILQPKQIPFVSYPYEWSFGQLKDAALLTLAIQKHSLRYGLTLKDASAYNIQFLDGKPILIDTLSFETYQEGQAWIAYKQFCQYFLAPLVLMSQKDVRLSQLLRVYIDGIPLDLAASLLPKKTLLRSGIAVHLHLHAGAQKRYAGKPAPKPGVSSRQRRLSTQSLTNIVDSLRSAIKALSWDHGRTSWSGYYRGDSYQEGSFTNKCALVSEYLDVVDPKCVWDLGANAGVFSRIASGKQAFTVSIDSDPGVVEANYIQTKVQKETHLHPLLIDLTNPSAAIGWANSERDGLVARSRADCVLALALVHHLAIGNNVPLGQIATFLASLAEWLIVEFVPKSDAKVQRLLDSREDIFVEYEQCRFEEILGRFYEIIRSQTIRHSERILYLLQRKP